MRLAPDTLHHLPPQVERFGYDRDAQALGIVHFGIGAFHRAHQAWYLHRLMQAGQAQDWAIVGAGVRPYDEAMRQKMAAQDYLTTLIELDPAGSSAEVVGSMIDYVPIVEGNGPLIEKLADPAIRIVALTVTEGGYFLDPATKNFDPAHPDIQHDIATPEAPKTAFGAMIAALRTRRAAGDKPFTCQSCDNLPGNGDKLREVVLGLAGLMDGSVSTLAPIFATAFATQDTWTTFLVGLAASVGAGISMGFTEAASDDGQLSGRGSPVKRGIASGVMTTLGGLGHALPYLIPDFWTATTVAILVVFVELWAIAWIQNRFMETPMLRAAFQVVLGGALVFAAGVLIGSG